MANITSIETALINAGFGPRQVGDHLVIAVGTIDPDGSNEDKVLASGNAMLPRIQAIVEPMGGRAEHHDSGETIMVYSDD